MPVQGNVIWHEKFPNYISETNEFVRDLDGVKVYVDEHLKRLFQLKRANPSVNLSKSVSVKAKVFTYDIYYRKFCNNFSEVTPRLTEL